MIKHLLFLTILIIVLFLILFFLRLLTDEDNWICQNGQWVKHGQPASPQPITSCPK